MSVSKSMMLMCRPRSFICRRSFSATPLPLDTAKTPLPLDTAKTPLPLDTARTRSLWASHFRMEKELLHNRFNIFLFEWQ
jgi:hypothetical protein